MIRLNLGKDKQDLATIFFKRIINKKIFTYRLLIMVLDKYLKKGDRVLDVGCGGGNLSVYMAKMNLLVLGIDVDLASIKECRKKAKNLNLGESANFLKIDITKNKIWELFDLITCFEVLEHISHYLLAVKKMASLLKPKGILIISTPSKNAPLYRLGMTKREDRRAGHLRRYTMEELTGLLKSAGLKIVETRKTEGIFRNFLFYNRLGRLPLKLANRFWIVSDIFTFIDNITLKLFGESQLIVVAQKPKIKGK